MTLDPRDREHRPLLQRIADRAMIERGLLPEFSPEALAELGHLPQAAKRETARDLSALLWCSIDNDESRDLDQLTVAEAVADGVKVSIAVADVDAMVPKESEIDAHARQNTTSVYTVAKVFPMLPEKLSTDLTSLNEAADRSAVVVEMVVDRDGSLLRSDLYVARVRNHARLTYNGVAAWLEGAGPPPAKVAAVSGLADNLRLQDQAAQRMKALRRECGALSFETVEARLIFDDGRVRDVQAERKNRAKEMIENFMIAANGATARFLASKKIPSLRRVVRSPKRWERIVELARERRFPLPERPDSKALEEFLTAARAADPEGFPDLSLSVIKLMGPGEYVVEVPGEPPAGHFGLAARDYTHSTAPNRRYPDLITQRLLKAALDGAPLPYSAGALSALAKQCTEKEDAAKKVERQVRKSAAALFLQSRIGETFDAVVTGAAAKGTWVRLLRPPIEGRLVSGLEGVDVGRKIRVQLLQTDAERGFIDFKRVD